MRHLKRTAKLGRTGQHRNAMLANLVCSLIKHKRVTTTLAKAKAARSVAEKMVTLGKSGTLHDRRLAAARLHQEDAVQDPLQRNCARAKGAPRRLHPHRPDEPAPGRRLPEGHPRMGGSGHGHRGSGWRNAGQGNQTGREPRKPRQRPASSQTRNLCCDARPFKDGRSFVYIPGR